MGRIRPVFGWVCRLAVIGAGVVSARAEVPADFEAMSPQLREAITRRQNLPSPLAVPVPAGESSNAGAVAAALRDGSRQAPHPVQVNSSFFESGRVTQTGARIARMSNGNFIVAFDDSASLSTGNGQHVVGYAVSDGPGAGSFTDKGALQDSIPGDGGYPSLAVDNSTGRVYLTCVPFGVQDNLPVFRSDDNGQTFGVPVNAALGFAGAGAFMDVPCIAVDNFAGRAQGTVYVSFTSFEPGNPGRIRVLRSADGGDNWTNAAGLGFLVDAESQGSALAVSPNHDVHVAYYKSQNIMTARSTDDGETFGTPVSVNSGPLQAAGVNGNLGIRGGFRTDSFPRIATHPADPALLYIVYNDNSFGTSNADVFFAGSEDSGATWGTPALLNDDPVGYFNDQFWPDIAVTGDGAHLLVTYQDRRLDPRNDDIDQWGRVADISGTDVEFKPSFRITPQSYPVVIGVDPSFSSTYMGNANKVIASEHDFHFAYAAHQAGGGLPYQPDVFYTSIPGDGPGDILSIESIRYSGDDGDASWSPDECVAAHITVVNHGSEAATNTLAFVHPVPEGPMTVLNSPVEFPLIPPGGRAESLTPVRMHATTYFSCGETVSYLVGLQSSKTTSAFSTAGTVLGDAGMPTQFASAAAVSIPDADPAGVDSPITVSGFTGDLFKLTVSANIPHTFAGDLEISLVAPDGREVALAFNAGGSGNNYGTDCPADENDATFDEDASQHIASGVPPFVGTFRPLEKLSMFQGLIDASVNGTWKLHVADVAGADTGTIECWSLNLYPEDCIPGGGTCEFTPTIVLGSFDDKSFGNGNFQPDPGECISMRLFLVNKSQVPGTNLTAAVSSSGPEFIVYQEATTFPDVAPKSGAISSDASPILLTVTDGALCGRRPTLRVHLVCDQGEYNVNVPVTALEPESISQSFEATGPFAIPDNDPGGIFVDIPVSGVQAPIQNVQVGLYLTHTFTGDLHIDLISPGNETVNLFERRGGSRNNLGSSCPVSSDDAYFFDFPLGDSNDASPPYAGQVLNPEEPLARFTGLSGTEVNGMWRLFVRDEAGADTGNVECVKLFLISSECLPGGGECTSARLRLDSHAFTGGNGDGFLDPDECLDLAVTLENFGPNDLDGISATLTAVTPGVTVVSDEAGWNDMAAGTSSANIVPFRLSTDPMLGCGTVLEFLMTVQTNQGNAVVPVRMTSGHPDPAFHSYSVLGPVAIPDNNSTGTLLAIPVSGFSGSLREVEVTCHITHSFDGDLNLSLVSPMGITVSLSTRRGSSGHNFGTDCPADSNDTTFDDDAAESVTSGTAPFAGSFRPESPLAAFSGLTAGDVNGTWLFRVADRAALDTGNIECVQLKLSRAECTAGGGDCPTSTDALEVLLGNQPPPADVNFDGVTDCADIIDGYVP
ncbi:proprotein convertase P-domain-containing protein [Candidatus Poribacteria bacterium]|nr:proprotein convertase P-domain-containing protein [Candidatus Poribacteria bacterium]